MIRMMFSSYRNHILWLSIYVAALAHAVTGWTSSLVSLLVTVFSVVGISSELRYMYHRRTLPPGDSGLPFVGHFPMEVLDPLAFSKAHVKRYGDPCTFNIFMYPCVFLVKDEDVAWALKQERKGNAGAFILEHFQRVIGTEAIMFQSGEQHKRLRKIFEPAFTPLAIRNYLSVMDQVTQETLARLSKTGDFSEPREWALLALRIFCRCAFGEVDEDKNRKLCNIFEGWINGMESIIPFELPFTPLAKSHQCKNELGKLLREMISDFKAQARPEQEGTQKSLLGRLVYSVDDDGNPPTEAQMIDNIRFILFAGFDTTKSSFGAISLYLTERRQVYQLLVEEVRGFADPLDFDELKCAPILNAVLAETWRLNAPLSSHSVRTNCDLEYKHYRFPKGTLLVLDTQSYHEFNEELYPDASTFRIERWLRGILCMIPSIMWTLTTT